MLSEKSNRLHSLLKNLEDRRDNKWKKHNVEAEGPKKLKDIKNDIDREDAEMNTKVESKTKNEIEDLN